MRAILTAARQRHVFRGYTDDAKILALGVCEEAGEVAAAVLDASPEYKPNDRRVPFDVKHEIVDLLIYAFALAYSSGIDRSEPI